MTTLKNRRNKNRFTELLEELVCRKACDLPGALLLLSKNKNKKNKAVALAAQNLNDSLKAKSILESLKINELTRPESIDYLDYLKMYQLKFFSFV